MEKEILTVSRLSEGGSDGFAFGTVTRRQGKFGTRLTTHETLVRSEINLRKRYGLTTPPTWWWMDSVD